MDSEFFTFETCGYIISGLILVLGASKIVRSLKSTYLPKELKKQSLHNGILFCLSGSLGMLSIYLNQNCGTDFLNYAGFWEFIAANLFFCIAVGHYIDLWENIKALPADNYPSDHTQTGVDKQSVLSQKKKELKN